jgi:hypothetical protein
MRAGDTAHGWRAHQCQAPRSNTLCYCIGKFARTVIGINGHTARTVTSTRYRLTYPAATVL